MKSQSRKWPGMLKSESSFPSLLFTSDAPLKGHPITWMWGLYLSHSPLGVGEEVAAFPRPQGIVSKCNTWAFCHLCGDIPESPELGVNIL